MVMRYMSGGSLSQRIREKRPTLAEAASIIGHFAPALDKAHRRGLIHRDIKPDNILFDEDNLAYLSDFGIVKMTEGQTMTLDYPWRRRGHPGLHEPRAGYRQGEARRPKRCLCPWGDSLPIC